MHSNYVTCKKEELMVMKPFHLTGFFLEKGSTMWWCTTVCESSLLVPNPTITKAFPEPRCCSVLSPGREQEGFCSRFAVRGSPQRAFVQGGWALVHSPQSIYGWGRRIVPVAPWELWENLCRAIPGSGNTGHGCAALWALQSLCSFGNYGTSGIQPSPPSLSALFWDGSGTPSGSS